MICKFLWNVLLPTAIDPSRAIMHSTSSPTPSTWLHSSGAETDLIGLAAAASTQAIRDACVLHGFEDNILTLTRWLIQFQIKFSSWRMKFAYRWDAKFLFKVPPHWGINSSLSACVIVNANASITLFVSLDYEYFRSLTQLTWIQSCVLGS